MPLKTKGQQNDQSYTNDNELNDMDLSLYILNESNKYITKEYIEKMLQKYGVTHCVSDLSVFQRALTHTSYLKKDERTDKTLKLFLANKDNSEKKDTRDLQPIQNPDQAIPLQELSYERLEFLGDSVIHLVLADYLYQRYDNQYEGFMTKLRTKLENGQSLANLTKAIGLHQYILISRNIEQMGGRLQNVHILEDAFESFIGALYLDTGNANDAITTYQDMIIDLLETKLLKDITKSKMNDIKKAIRKVNTKNLKSGNYELCKHFIIAVIEKEIDIASLLYKESNYKDSILQYYHRMKWDDPIYDMIELAGPEHKKIFKMVVRGPNNTIVGHGSGNSKKKGEQEAAKMALLKFGVIKEESDEEEEEYIECDE